MPLNINTINQRFIHETIVNIGFCCTCGSSPAIVYLSEPAARKKILSIYESISKYLNLHYWCLESVGERKYYCSLKRKWRYIEKFILSIQKFRFLDNSDFKFTTCLKHHLACAWDSVELNIVVSHYAWMQTIKRPDVMNIICFFHLLCNELWIRIYLRLCLINAYFCFMQILTFQCMAIHYSSFI